MNFQTLQNILTLSENRISFLSTKDTRDFYKGNQTFLDGIYDELDEVKKEIQDKKYIQLEDELWDVFWDYLCFLESLEKEWKIQKARIFERCYLKFSERLNLDGSTRWNWNETKQIQKERLQKEQSLYSS